MLRHFAAAVSAVVLTLAVAACASDASQSSNTGTVGNRTLEDQNFRVGSRIPIKDPVSSSPTSTVNPSAAGAAPRN